MSIRHLESPKGQFVHRKTEREMGNFNFAVKGTTSCVLTTFGEGQRDKVFAVGGERACAKEYHILGMLKAYSFKRNKGNGMFQFIGNATRQTVFEFVNFKYFDHFCVVYFLKLQVRSLFQAIRIFANQAEENKVVQKVIFLKEGGGNFSQRPQSLERVNRNPGV